MPIFKHFAQRALGIFPVRSEAMPPQCYLRGSEASIGWMGPLEITQGLGQVSVPLSSQAVSISKGEVLMTMSAGQPDECCTTHHFLCEKTMTNRSCPSIREIQLSCSKCKSPVARTQPLLSPLSPRSLLSQETALKTPLLRQYLKQVQRRMSQIVATCWDVYGMHWFCLVLSHPCSPLLEANSGAGVVRVPLPGGQTLGRDGVTFAYGPFPQQFSGCLKFPVEFKFQHLGERI